MLPTLVRRLAQAAAKPHLSTAAANPVYKLKKVWPPDMRTMSAQQQLRFEKKYKRRLKIATARPRWDKFVRLAQLFTITCRMTTTTMMTMMIAAAIIGFLSARLTTPLPSCHGLYGAVHGLEGCADTL